MDHRLGVKEMRLRPSNPSIGDKSTGIEQGIPSESQRLHGYFPRRLFLKSV